MSDVKTYHPDLAPLSWLFGTWESVSAVVAYPTMETLNYKEVMEFQPDTAPFIQYKSDTWHPVKKEKLHCESGFLKVDPKTGMIALLVAHHFGLTEISEGTVQDQSLKLESKQLSDLSFSGVVSVLKIIRHLAVKDGELQGTMFLQTATQPLQKHLETKYRKKD